MLKQIILASGNKGKLAELSQLLAPLNIQVNLQSEFGVTECEEPFDTFIENALIKARHASRITGLPALADDSGLCVDALGGMPGVYSARYAGEPKSDDKNNQKLCQTLAEFDDKKAYYYSVCVLVRHPNDPQPIITDGRWHGQIILEPRGAGGFGYDPYFYIPSLDKTAAELSPLQKNQFSHRGQAMRLLVEKLRDVI